MKAVTFTLKWERKAEQPDNLESDMLKINQFTVSALQKLHLNYIVLEVHCPELINMSKYIRKTLKHFSNNALLYRYVY